MQMSLTGRYEERGATVECFSVKLKLIEPFSDVVWELLPQDKLRVRTKRQTGKNKKRFIYKIPSEYVLTYMLDPEINSG